MATATCNSAKCVEALGNDVNALLHLLPLLRCSPPHSELLMGLLTSLAAHQKVVGAFLRHGGLLHALYLFACAQVSATHYRSSPP